MLGSVFNKTENFASIGLKVKVLSETNELPAIAFTLKTNNDWYRSDNPDLNEKLPEVAGYGLRSISYDTKITHLIISLSKKTSEISRMHVAFGLGDLRNKNVKSYFFDSFFIDESTKMKNNFYGAFGFEVDLSESTKLIFEGQTIPYFKINGKTGLISPDLRKVFAGGLRVVVAHWLLLDGGFRYQDNYRGLADTEVKISLQAFINVEKGE